MKTLCDTHLPPPSTSDERAVIPPPNAEFLKQLMLIYHNESIFSTNGAIGEEPIIQPKTKGAGIMVSDFIEQYDRHLQVHIRSGSSSCWY